MPQVYKGFTIPADLDTADNPAAFAAFVDSIADALVPTGVIWLYAKATPPTGWLLCQGQSLATTGTYADLFAVLGYSYGGSGAAFLLPNLSGRVPMGVGGSTGINTQVGADTKAIDISNVPTHAHGGAVSDQTTNHGHTAFGAAAGGGYVVATGSGGPWTAGGGSGLQFIIENRTNGADSGHIHGIPAEGGGVPLDIRQKSLGLAFIIKI